MAQDQSYSLTEAAQRAGVDYQLLRKHVQRGKLRTTKDGSNRVVVSDADLSAYLATEGLAKASSAAEGRPLAEVTTEIGNVIQRLPARVIEAILNGIPSSKRPGDAKQFLAAVEGIPKNRVVAPPPDDPHCGYPVGYQHRSSPRWRRTSETTWTLGDASWSWNGLFWEGGGSRSGREIGVGISPADPDAAYRPAPPPKAMAK